MKKLITLLLCLLMLLQLASCGQNDNLPIAPNQEPEPPLPVSYDGIIDLYTKALNLCKKYSIWTWATIPQSEFDALAITDARDKEFFSKLFFSAHKFYPYTNSFDPTSAQYKPFSGYSEKDLNGDGVNELILLCDYSVVAIFTARNGVPFLLNHYTPEDIVWISENGYVHERAHKDNILSCRLVYRIADDCSSLELIDEFGIRSDTDANAIFDSKYYKLTNGEYTEINESAYLDLEQQHGRYLDWESCAKITKTTLEGSFTNLFTPDENAMYVYKSVLNIQTRVYIDTHRSEYLMYYRLPGSNLPLYEIRNLKHAYLDTNGDSVSELILDAGELLQLQYKDEKVYIEPISEQALTTANGGSPVQFSPVVVSWNQLFTEDQAKGIATKHWGFKNNENLGRPSPNVINVFRIEVADAFQANGSFYYHVISYIDSYKAPLGKGSKPFQMQLYEEIYINRKTGACEDLIFVEDGK